MPPFNAQGDLPPGVHQATRVEVVERFGQGVPERVRVTERLQQVIALAQGTGKVGAGLHLGQLCHGQTRPTGHRLVSNHVAGLRVERLHKYHALSV